MDLPTTLGHDELGWLRRMFGRKALILARAADARVLSAVHERVSELARGIQDAPGNYMDQATFRLEMREILDASDYRPQEGREGTISDLTTEGRLDLISRTETDLAAARAQQAVDFDPDTLDAFPAYELVRGRSPDGKPRDWESRWRIAAAAANDDAAIDALAEHGRMVAAKDSKVWRELGSTDHFPDALDTDHPPFAFSSGMDTRNISRAQAVKLGVIKPGQEVKARQERPPVETPKAEDVNPAIRRIMTELNKEAN